MVVRTTAIAWIAYLVSEKLQMLMFAFGPSLKPIYDHLTREWMLGLFFVWVSPARGGRYRHGVSTGPLGATAS
jgi:hypothetical protein